MSTSLFHGGIPVLEKVLRTVGVYVGLLVLLRVAGKRDLAQLNSFDLVVLLLLSNVVQNAVIGPDNTLTGGLLGAAVLVAANAAVVRFVNRDDRLLRAFEGSPTVLVRDGEVDHAALAKLGLRPSDVRTALSRQGADTLADVAEARLEPGGAIVLELAADATPARRSDLARLDAKLDELLRRSAP
jgi:uncharacterized membrane protein YcaP (DUF421 family)